MNKHDDDLSRAECRLILGGLVVLAAVCLATLAAHWL